ncbi:hypothetical protein V1517DRAFT_329402 [Lipomyces orientalis]|uniref:Uncharacterized protein n=1 Tax=Lipomyces orientalis TaxID=1233043 RepID=A0ACC3THR5_9ASCO
MRMRIIFDYLAIPASEVAVERLFNSGRDLLGLRRHSLSTDYVRHRRRFSMYLMCEYCE